MMRYFIRVNQAEIDIGESDENDDVLDQVKIKLPLIDESEISRRAMQDDIEHELCEMLDQRPAFSKSLLLGVQNPAYDFEDCLIIMNLLHQIEVMKIHTNFEMIDNRVIQKFTYVIESLKSKLKKRRNSFFK